MKQKKIIAIILMSILCESAAFACGTAHLEFGSSVCHFGIIKQGSDNTRYITFQNTGDEPLIVDYTHSACGCTSATITNKPIMPGQKGEMMVKYDTEKIGAFSKIIIVVSNSDGGARDVFRIDGKVVKKESTGCSVRMLINRFFKWFLRMVGLEKKHLETV